MLCLAFGSEHGSPLAIPTPEEEQFIHQVFTGHLEMDCENHGTVILPITPAGGSLMGG